MIKDSNKKLWYKNNDFFNFILVLISFKLMNKFKQDKWKII